jgi:hypothetical protein
MPAEYAEARNIVFHKDDARRHTFPDRGHTDMSTTIEQFAATHPSESELASARASGFIAQWQSGPQTFFGLEQRKLRLVLARLPLDATNLPNAQPIMKGASCYAIR